jgi:hypothetical protein
MSNALKQPIVDAFKTIRGLIGGGVAVTSGTYSTMAIVKYDSTNEMGERGTTGQIAGNVRAILAELPEVSLTEKCTVAGVEVFVINPRKDAAEATIVFDFTSTMPQEDGQF